MAKSAKKHGRKSMCLWLLFRWSCRFGSVRVGGEKPKNRTKKIKNRNEFRKNVSTIKFSRAQEKKLAHATSHAVILSHSTIKTIKERGNRIKKERIKTMILEVM